MLCQINKKRGSVKYYINELPVNLIKIIKQNIYFKKSYEYKNHKKNNKYVLKELKKDYHYFCTKIKFFSNTITNHSMMTKKNSFTVIYKRGYKNGNCLIIKKKNNCLETITYIVNNKINIKMIIK